MNRKVFFVLVLLLNIAWGWGQTTFFFQPTSGNPVTLSNWNTQESGGGSTPANFTGASDVFIIPSGKTATGTSAWSVSNQVIVRGTLNPTSTSSSHYTAKTWVIESGANVNITNAANVVTSSGTFTCAGTVTKTGSGVLTLTSSTATFQNGGIYYHDDHASNAVIPTATWQTGSTCRVRYTGTSNFQISNYSQEFYNLIWDWWGDASINYIFEASPPTFKTGGTFSLTQSRGIVGLANTTTARSWTIENLVIEGGTFFIAGASAGATAHQLTINGNLSVTGGTFHLNRSSTANDGSTAPILNIKGNMNYTGGTLGNGFANYGIINFNGTNTQTYTGTSAFNGVYIRVYVKDGATFFVPKNNYLAGGFDNTSGFAQFNVESGGTLIVGDADGFSNTASGTTGAIRMKGTRSYSTSGNYGYQSDVAQVTGNGLPATVNNLTINNSHGSGVSLTNGVTVNGTLLLSNGTFNLNSNTLTMADNSNIVRTAGTVSASPTYTDNVNVTYGDGVYASAITTGNELPTAVSGKLRNLTINASGGVTLDAATALRSTGTLTLTNGILSTTSVNTLTIANTASGAVSGGSASAYINGPLDRTLDNSLNYAYPIGGATLYRPISLNNVSVSGNPVVRLTMAESGATTGDGSSIESSLLSARNWHLEQISGTFSNATLVITESGLENGTHKISKSNNNQAGTYVSVGSPQTVSGGAITSSSAQGVGCYAIGVSSACNNPDNGGEIASSHAICYNGDPTAFTSSSPASGQMGALEYKWQYSNDEAWTSPIDIASSDSETYDAPSGLTADRWYRRLARVTCVADWSGAVVSNVVKVTVNANVTAGTIATDQTICSGTSPNELTSTADGTGSGTITYEWQANASGSWADVVGATAATYQPPSLTETTSYKRRTKSVSSGATCYSPYTDAVVITVHSSPSISVQPTTKYACPDNDVEVFSVVASGDGLTYQWQVNTGSGWENVSNGGVYSNATTANLSITNASVAYNAYQYRCVVSGTCSPSATSNSVSLFVHADNCVAGSSGDFMTAQNGNWNQTSTWKSHNGSTWEDATSTPTNTDGKITIRTGHTVTVTAAVSVDEVLVEAGGQVAVNNVTLTIANGSGDDFVVNGILKLEGASGVITTTGNVVFNAGSQYQHARNGGVIPTASWHANSTCNVSGMQATAPTGIGQTFGNFIWNCTGQTAIFPVNNNSFVIQSGSVFTLESTNTSSFSMLYYTAAGDQAHTNTWGGSLMINNGVFVVQRAVHSSSNHHATLSVNNLTINGGTLRLNANDNSSYAPDGFLYINGNVTITAGTVDLMTSTSSSSSAEGYLYLKGNLTWSGGAIMRTNTSASGPHSNIKFDGVGGVTQTYTQTLGSVTHTSNGRGIVWEKTGASNVDNVFIGTSGNTFGLTNVRNITVNCTGTCTFSNATTVNGIFYMTQGIVSFPSGLTYGGSASLVYNGTTPHNCGEELFVSFARPVTINNSAGVRLTRTTTTSSTITLTSGVVDATDYMFIITNTATSAINSGNDSSYINGPLRRSLAASLGTGTYVYPIGSANGFYPFTISEVVTGATGPVIQLEVNEASTGGTRGIGAISISETEYWYANIVSGNYTNGRISVSRKDDLGDFDVIARSATLGGLYDEIGGTVSGAKTVVNSDVTGAALGYFLVAEEGCEPPTLNAQYNGEEYKIICLGQSYDLSANPDNEGGCANWQYAWFTGDGLGNTYWDGTDWDNAETWHSSYKNITNVSPALTTTYFVKVRCEATPSCVYNDTEGVTVLVNSIIPDAPTGDAEQSFCSGALVVDLVADGSNIKWYDAVSGGSLLNSSLALVNATNYYASQTVDACESSDRLVVEVDLVTFTIANAGSDQFICATSATLAGNQEDSGETGVWTLVSGAGTITTPSLYNTTVSDLGVGANVFRWTITKGSCVSSDEVIIHREEGAPLKAVIVSPTHLATNVDRVGTSLQWSNGGGANSYNVFWGTVSPGDARGNQSDTSYSCSDMNGNVVYYWRIDAINSCGATTGDIWSYTTEPGQSYYVNDASDIGDVYTSVIGNDGSGDGTSGAPYRTISALLAAKVLGPGDIVYIDAGTYSETGINIGTADDGGGGKYVTFKGAGADKTHFNAAATAHTFNFAINSVQYIKVMDLKISKNSSSYSAVNFSGQNISNIVFENCEFSQAGNRALIYGQNTGGLTACNNIRFENCKITYSGTGSSGYSVHFLGRYNNLIIRNCTITNSSAVPALYFSSGTSSSNDGLTNLRIENNSISTSHSSSLNVRGIEIVGKSNNTTISNNAIVNTSSDSRIFGVLFRALGTTHVPLNASINNNIITTYGTGIGFQGDISSFSTGVNIFGNNINILSVLISPSYHKGVSLINMNGVLIHANRIDRGGSAIYMQSNVTNSRVYNNYITNSSRGVDDDNTTNKGNVLYFNSFYVKGEIVAKFRGDNWIIKNNIFYNNSLVKSTKTAVSVDADATLATFVMDYNLYYVPNGASYGNVAGSSYSTFESWKTKTSGEANAQQGNPYFDNPDNKNLDITTNLTLSKARNNGTAISSFTTDINNSIRNSTTPFIGAYESFNTLPVNLMFFDVECGVDRINFAWATVSEINSDYFELEYSFDAQTWYVQARIAAAGVSNQLLNYQYQLNDSLLSIIRYFRLIQYDFDGTRNEISKPVSLACKESKFDDCKIQVYPNPNNGSFFIACNNDDEKRIKIYDFQGRVVEDFIWKFNTSNMIEVQGLQRGVYIVKVLSKTTMSVAKVICD